MWKIVYHPKAIMKIIVISVRQDNEVYEIAAKITSVYLF